MKKDKFTPILPNLEEVHKYLHAMYRREFNILSSTGREFTPDEINNVILKIFLEDVDKRKPIMDKSFLNCLLVIALSGLKYKLAKADGEYGYTRDMKESIDALSLYKGYTNILKIDIIISSMKNIYRYEELLHEYLTKQKNPKFKDDNEEQAFTWYRLFKQFKYDAVYTEHWFLYLNPQVAPEAFD